MSVQTQLMPLDVERQSSLNALASYNPNPFFRYLASPRDPPTSEWTTYRNPEIRFGRQTDVCNDQLFGDAMSVTDDCYMSDDEGQRPASPVSVFRNERTASPMNLIPTSTLPEISSVCSYQISDRNPLCLHRMTSSLSMCNHYLLSASQIRYSRCTALRNLDTEIVVTRRPCSCDSSAGIRS